MFKLLGNSPDDLFFPKNIIVVEGPSDREFINRLLALKRYPAIAIHYAGGAEEEVSRALPAIEQMLKTVSYLPVYKRKVCVLVDDGAAPRRVEEWKEYLGDEEGKRVVVLGKNGIEHYYPKDILSEITGISIENIDQRLGEYLERVRRNEKDPAFGSFDGGKLPLAREVSKRLEVEHLA